MNWSFGNGWSADTGSENGESVTRLKHLGVVVATLAGRASTDDLLEKIAEMIAEGS